MQRDSRSKGVWEMLDSLFNLLRLFILCSLGLGWLPKTQNTTQGKCHAPSKEVYECIECG